MRWFRSNEMRRERSLSPSERRCRVVASRRFMKERYTPLVISREGKTLVLLGSLGIFVAGVYGVTQACLMSSE